MYCDKCGKKVKDSSQFCEYCGHSLKGKKNKNTKDIMSKVKSKSRAEELIQRNFKFIIVVAIVVAFVGIVFFKNGYDMQYNNNGHSWGAYYSKEEINNAYGSGIIAIVISIGICGVGFFYKNHAQSNIIQIKEQKEKS